jgi:hypothetical protein
VSVHGFSNRQERLTDERRKSVFAPSQELSLDDFLPQMDHEGGHVKLQIADWSGLPDDPVPAIGNEAESCH